MKLLKKSLLIAVFFISNFIGNGQNLTSGEYFFNSDPGLGQGTAFTLTPGDTANQLINVSTSGLTPGFHQIGVRVKRADGIWGQTNQQILYVATQQNPNNSFGNLVSGEYFFNTDPGLGQGTAFTIAPGDTANLLINVSTSGLTPGFHQIGVRVKRADGIWGQTIQQIIYIAEATQGQVINENLIKGEYFFNSDPGLGQGTAFAIAPGDTANQLINVSTSGLTPGFHQIGVRVKRADGIWGQTIQQIIYIAEATQGQVINENLIKGEYFFNNDPGLGNGEPFSFSPQTNWDSIVDVFTQNLSYGIHQIGFRVQRSDGIWSHTFQQEVEVINCLLYSADTTIYEVSCDSFFFANTMIFQSGIYHDTLVNQLGCDSVVILDLTIQQSSFTQINEGACQSYFWKNKNLTQSGIYLDTLTNSHGCDSLIELLLTINHSTTSFDTVATCDNYFWLGNLLTQSGFYQDTLTNSKGCDSLVHLSLTLYQSSFYSQTDTACINFFWQNQVFTQSGVYNDTLTNNHGCDSILELNLTIFNPTSSSQTIVSCQNYTWQGITLTQSGIYYDTIPNIQGCDSLMTLNLTIRNSTNENFSADVCGSYTWQGKTLTQSGIYYDTIPNAQGCDSLMTLNLTIRNSTSETFTADVCGSYTWQGMMLTQSGIYYDTIPNIQGCDSLMTLNLTIRNSTSETFTADVCESYLWQGMMLTQSGIYYDTIPNAQGCDSLMTLNLTIRNSTSETFTANVCESYTWQGMTLTQSGIYYDTIPNAQGCDSLMTLNLTIRNYTTETFTADVCESYLWQGMMLTQSGIYYDTIPNAQGCDSLMTLNLTIRNSTNENFSADVCGSYTWQGMMLTQSGIYYDTIPNAQGCDSLMTLNLTIRNSTTETFTADVCGSYLWQGKTLTQSGIYYDTIPNAQGCDSLMTLNLTIDNVDLLITQNGFTLNAVIGQDSYQWIDCGKGNMPIPGETNESFTATENGEYAAIITNGICVDTSLCINVTGIGIESLLSEKFHISIFPNPGMGVFYLNVNTGNTKQKTFDINITSIEGRLVFKKQSIVLENHIVEKIDLSDLSNGVYFLTITKGSEAVVEKIMITK